MVTHYCCRQYCATHARSADVESRIESEEGKGSGEEGWDRSDALVLTTDHNNLHHEHISLSALVIIAILLVSSVYG